MIGSRKAFLMVARSNSKYGPDLEAHQQLLMAASDIFDRDLHGRKYYT
jgi:hypothetical protein